MANIAIYGRVSKGDQHAESQLRELREWCARCGHTIVAEYIDVESGKYGAGDKRPELARLLDDAGKRRFDMVVVWALDRLSREGMAKTVHYLELLTSHGVAFHSCMEPMISTDNELVRDIVIAVMAGLAKVERARIAARTKAGLARVKVEGTRSGKAIGRPALDPVVVARIRSLAGDGLRPYRIGKLVGVDAKTVTKYVDQNGAPVV